MVTAASWGLPKGCRGRSGLVCFPNRYSQDFTHCLSIPVARPNIDVQGGRAKEGSRAQQCDALPWRRAAFQSGIPRDRARSNPSVSRVRNPCSVSSRLIRLPSGTGSSSSTCAVPLPRKQSALMPCRKWNCASRVRQPWIPESRRNLGPTRSLSRPPRSDKTPTSLSVTLPVSATLWHPARMTSWPIAGFRACFFRRVCGVFRSRVCWKTAGIYSACHWSSGWSMRTLEWVNLTTVEKFSVVAEHQIHFSFMLAGPHSLAALPHHLPINDITTSSTFPPYRMITFIWV